MNLNHVCINILDQLSDLVIQIKEADFYKPVEVLSRSTVGQHLRHTLEFFICLEQGLAQGCVNYDKRTHDKLIETDKSMALAAIDRIKRFLMQSVTDKSLVLEVGYDIKSEDFLMVGSTYMRELVYNIEHAVHHMALIKIGIKECASYVCLPDDFGVAASTMRYQESLVSSR